MNVYPVFRLSFALAFAMAIAGASRQPFARLIVAELALILVFSAGWQVLIVYLIEGAHNVLARRTASAVCVIIGTTLVAAGLLELVDVERLARLKKATDDALFWALVREGIACGLFIGSVCARRDLRERRLV